MAPRIPSVMLMLALGGAAVIGSGCQSSPDARAERPATRGEVPMPRAGGVGATAGTAGGAGRAGRTSATPVTPSVSALGPISARSLAYAVPRNLEYAGPKGESMVVRRGPPPDCLCAGRTWVVKSYELDGPAAVAGSAVDAGGAKASRERTFTVLPGGGIGLTEQIDREEGVEVVFDPPLLVMPDGLPLHALGSAEMAQDLTMTVHPLGDRNRVKASGKARNVVRYLADETLTTPAGAFTARRIESVLTADLAPARIANTTQQWFVDGVGMVREQDRERTTVFGVPTRNNTSDWILQAYRAE